jgi:hypothetical protein
MPGQVPVPCRIFRIVHYDNLAGIIEQGGMWCGAEMLRRGLPYKQIGLHSLTANRKDKTVPVGKGGNLSDYVAFHFCARSIMLCQIHSGMVETYQEGQEPVLHLVTTVERVRELDLPYAFTDRHAKTRIAGFFDDHNDLGRVDWDIIKSQRFARTEDDPDRPTRKEAEFLVHKFVPLNAILGIGVFSQRWKDDCDGLLREGGIGLQVKVQPGWYF